MLCQSTLNSTNEPGLKAAAMRFWQIFVIAMALILLSVVALRWMPAAFSSVSDSEWLAAVIFGFFFGGAAISGGIVYGVWWLGDRG